MPFAARFPPSFFNCSYHNSLKETFEIISRMWKLADTPVSPQQPSVTKEKWIFPIYLAKTLFWLIWLLADCCGRNLNCSDGLAYKHLLSKAPWNWKVWQTRNGEGLPSKQKLHLLKNADFSLKLLHFQFTLHIIKFHYHLSNSEWFVGKYGKIQATGTSLGLTHTDLRTQTTPSQ